MVADASRLYKFSDCFLVGSHGLVGRTTHTAAIQIHSNFQVSYILRKNQEKTVTKAVYSTDIITLQKDEKCFELIIEI